MSAQTVERWEFGAYVSRREVVSLLVAAAVLGVSEATARRHLDGLVAQGLVEVIPGRRGAHAASRLYVVPGRVPTEDDWRAIRRGAR